MSIYFITGVKLDAKGNVLRAKIFKAGEDAFKIIDGNDVASLVVKGDVVNSRFPDGSFGPKFKHVVFAGGSESATLEEHIQGFELKDLEQI